MKKKRKQQQQLLAAAMTTKLHRSLFASSSTLLLFLLSFLSASGSSEAGDLDLLIAFKASISNPQILPSWSRGDLSPCSFAGVSCDAGGHVVAVSLRGIPLNADFRSVSSSLLALGSLQNLTLNAVNLTGTLAAAGEAPCGGLLSQLDLSGNILHGSLVDVHALAEVCSGLKSLNLSGNSVGNHPADGAAAVGFKLEILDLSFNKISRQDELRWLFSSLGGLRHIDLIGNRINGGRFPEIANCSALQHLDLSATGLSGELGVGALGRCPSLRYLNLSSNHLAGSLPSDLSSCTSLTSISLSNNNFSGDLPTDALTSMPNLRFLELAFNNFSGSLGDSISKLPLLEVLDLSSNHLTGSIPSGLCPSPDFGLKELYLQNNQLTGVIPESLSNCTQLNSLEGEIPAELSNIRTLENLILDNNGLTGAIPPELVNCTNLNWISLSSNQLSGPLPSWIGQLRNLAILKLGNNSFSGPIPPELGDCKSLIWLDLNSNQLNGSIPPTLAKQSGNIAVGLVTGKRYVYLRNDGISSHCRGTGNLLEFAGIRPEDLNRLPSHRICNFTRVYMGSTQYTFNNNGSMIFLDLSYNQLSGQIAKEIGNMYYLMILNLGHNLLSGLIPTELGSLRFVAVLDLSHNALEGPIPSSFSGLAMLSEIDLSNNKLNGSIPELGQLATFPRCRYENNSGLCGFPLPSCEGNTGADSGNQHQKTHRRQAYLTGSIAMGVFVFVFCIFGLVIVAVEKRKRQRNGKGNSNNSRDFYIDSRSYSGAGISNWKLTVTKETLHSKVRISDVFDPELLKEGAAVELELLEHLKIACACLDDRPLRRPTMLKVMAMFKEIQAGSMVDSNASAAAAAAAAAADDAFAEVDMSLKEESKEEKC
ncbi:hypothetical protein OPV22_018460 [Ensete ventricosum]|uniref:non-specific serine/threonine protein kinase n=1 Tax=Ensete ventricosum TaxID=4639 RepID=A0AAV8QW02_ENSVE|nr:hypothetical protein OPV22_018460 [Ensete ventricosum]